MGIWKKPEAVHAPEVQWGADGSEVVTEVTFPFSQLHDYAKSIGVSPLSVLAPLMMKAFDDKFGGTDKPVIAEIPVDLRPLLPTLTTRYFICFIDLPYFPEYRDLPNDEVFRRTKAFLKDQMQREQLLYRAKAAADRCESLHEADMPLAEKMQAAQKVTDMFCARGQLSHYQCRPVRPAGKLPSVCTRLRRNPAVCCAAVCAADLVVWR